MMRRRAKRKREGQARERKKEGKPVYFGAHVKRTRFRKTRLVKSKKATGRSSYTTARHSTLTLGKLRVSQLSHCDDWCAKTKLQQNPKRRESSPTENAAAPTRRSQHYKPIIGRHEGREGFGTYPITMPCPSVTPCKHACTLSTNLEMPTPKELQEYSDPYKNGSANGAASNAYLTASYAPV